MGEIENPQNEVIRIIMLRMTVLAFNYEMVQIY